MAQDRIRYLCQRLEEGAAIAAVLEAARQHTNHRTDQTFYQLDRAMGALYDAAYIELPDDSA